MNIIETLEQEQIARLTAERPVPTFGPGDTLRVNFKVVEGDRTLDYAEVVLERLCLDTLALQQPLATDLRFLAGALKINNDLERMGDLACNVAKQTWRLSAPPVPEFADPFAELTETAGAGGSSRASEVPASPATPPSVTAASADGIDSGRGLRQR